MKLQNIDNELETFGVQSEEYFSIADMGMVFEILRHKMYSNPIGAICREITCNARDAHREVGKSDVPIHITLPNRLDPNFKVRDFGPGITPERMSNVFIKYAASTKRSDNFQTGGFGLGAKTPFSYSNTFNIVTVTDFVKRTYTAVIDESRIGKLLLTSEVSTDEANGTEIIIPIHIQDFSSFLNETVVATKHWEVKPVVHGGMISYTDYKGTAMLAGKNCFIRKGDYNEYGGNRIKVIVDGVEYPFDMSCIENLAKCEISYGHVLYLSFETGILSLAANREQIESDETSKKAIKGAITEMLASLKKTAEDKIASANTYSEACELYEEISKTIPIKSGAADVEWRGHVLHGKTYNAGYGTEFKIIDRVGRGSRHLLRTHYLSLTRECMFAIDDMPTDHALTVKQAAPFFDKHPGINKLQVCTQSWIDNCDKKEFDPSLFTFVKLSDYIKPKKVSARQYLGRLTFFKYNRISCSFARTSITEYEENVNEKVCVTLVNESTTCHTKYVKINGVKQCANCLSDFARTFNEVAIYGFMEDVDAKKLTESVQGIVQLEQYVKDYLDKKGVTIQDMNFIVDYKQNSDTSEILDRSWYNSVVTRMNEITSSTSVFVGMVNLIKTSKEIAEKHAEYLPLGTYLSEKIVGGGTTGVSIATSMENVLNTYKMFKFMQNSYYYNQSNNEGVDSIIEYINLIDANKTV